MNKTVVLVLVCVLASFALFAGGRQEAAAPGATPAAAEPKPVNLRFSSWLVMEGASKETLEQMVAGFERKNPRVKVEILGIPYEQTQQQTFVSVSGGNAPDVIHLVAQWSPPLMSMGAIIDLASYYTQAEISDIPKAAHEAGLYEGKLSSVPWQLGSITVMGWKKVLQDAGLPLAIPDTGAAFKDAVKKISKPAEGVYGFGARTSKDTNSAFWFFPVMWAHGGQFEDAQGKIMFGDPGTVAALAWYREIGTTRQTPIGMGVREVRNLMPQNKLGFIFDGPWMKGIFRNISGRGEAVDNDYVVGLFPKAVDGKRYGIANNHVLSVATQSKVKEQAIDLVKFLTQDEATTKLYYEKNGAIPTYRRLLADPLYGDPFAQAFILSAEFADSLPSKNPNFSAALEFVATAMQEALLGGDPARAAETARRAILTLYKQ